MKKLLLILIVGLALALPPDGAVMAGTLSPDLKAALATATADEAIPIIVRLRKKANLSQFKKLKRALRRTKIIEALKQEAEAGQTDILALLTNKNVKKLRKLWLVNGIAMEATPEVIRLLKKQPAVKEIRLDAVLMLSSGSGGGSGSAEWNLGMVQADTLWNAGVTGQGAVIASMDSGVDAAHNALSSSYRGGSNSWFDPNGEHSSPFDADGHGTQTMGVLVGADGMGIAPDAQWMAVKIFDDGGAAALSVIHAGFQWLLDPDNNPASDDAPDVVNNSWGFNDRVDECYDEFAADIEALRAAEIAVVFAGGNSGPGASTSISPGNNPGSLAVGAVDSGGQVISQSSAGPSACGGGVYPHLAAPGLSVLTASLTYGVFLDMTTYASGTSIAAPHVAGALTLLRSAEPGASVAAMEQALLDTALDAGSAGPDNDYGYGLAQVYDAYLAMGDGGGDPPPPPPPDPQCYDDDGDGFFSAASDPECGEPVDCDDTNAAVFPGAVEIAKDGIDQDCNGLDMTITITRALYNSKKDKVIVYATSDRGNQAGLSVDIPGIGLKTMAWNNNKNRWQKAISKAVSKGFDPANPGSVVVSGEEGEASLTVSIK
jgi:serine protease AprX